jgi:hypothetical protein
MRSYALHSNPVYLKNAARMMEQHAPYADRAWWRALKERVKTNTILPADEDDATARLRHYLGLD